MKKFLNIFIPVLFIGLIVYLISYIGLDTITNQEALKEYISRYGTFAPLVFFLIQFLQVLIAPIPGNITGLVGGALFGLWYGFLLNGAAVLLGSALMFYMGRKYGKKITHKFAGETELDKYEKKLSGKTGKSVLMGLFLLPFTPDDLLCLAAGLTDISTQSFFVIMIIGRLPSSFITNAVGAGLYSDKFLQIVLFSIIYYLLAFLFYINYDKIKAYYYKKSK